MNTKLISDINEAIAILQKRAGDDNPDYLFVIDMMSFAKEILTDNAMIASDQSPPEWLSEILVPESRVRIADIPATVIAAERHDEDTADIVVRLSIRRAFMALPLERRREIMAASVSDDLIAAYSEKGNDSK